MAKDTNSARAVSQNSGEVLPQSDASAAPWPASYRAAGAGSPLRHEVDVNQVRELRQQKYLTQAQLAVRAGVSVRTVFSVEHGRRCRWSTKRLILRALGIDFSERKTVFPE